jgi:hypothetical protein
MFTVPSGVLVGTRATGAAPGWGRRRAVTVRRTGAHRDRKRVEDRGCGRPGINAGRTGRGSEAETTFGDDVPAPDDDPRSEAMNPTATAPIAHATSRVRLTP